MKTQSLNRRGMVLPRTMMSLALSGVLFASFSGGENVQAAPSLQDGAADDASEWVGFVESIPAGGQAGDWTIGGRTFTVDSATTLIEEKQPLLVGTCAEVEFEASAAGDLATEVSGEYEAACDGGGEETDTDDEDTDDEDTDDEDTDDEDTDDEETDDEETDNEETDDEETDDEDTDDEETDDEETDDEETDDEETDDEETDDEETDDEDTDDEDTDDEDTDDEDTDDEDTDDEDTDDEDTDDEDTDDEDTDDEDSDDEDTDVFGAVDSMPSSGRIGTWTIAGVQYVATDATEFEEEQGTFAVGVSVEFEFSVVNGVNQLVEIETHRAPGAGSTTRTGKIESLDAALRAASLDSRATWQVGDTMYTVLPVTEQNEDVTALVVGATAEVNSYTAVDGTEVATLIRGVAAPAKVMKLLFLPSVWR